MIEIDDDLLEEEYELYYENILEQMKLQGFSKPEIYARKMMYEKRADLFDDFVKFYNNKYVINKEIILTLEDKNEN
jgi:hypothetical protein